jgi:predicted RNA-binding protein YlxR (DUF448 family)
MTVDEEDLPMNDRMCIVTRESGSADELIRFVAGPDGTVVPDLKRQLPGRGCSVKASRALVDQAIKKQLFARALKTEAKALPELGAMVDRLLLMQLTGMMNMARKAGQFISGTMKVDDAVRTGRGIAVFHATDAAGDGIRKITNARTAVKFMTDEEEEIPAFRLLSYDEMQELMGDNAFIHAVALAGQAGEGVVKRARLLETYRGGSAGPM